MYLWLCPKLLMLFDDMRLSRPACRDFIQQALVLAPQHCYLSLERL